MKTFPVKKDTPLEGRSSVTMSWLLPAVTDPVEIVTHEVISEILVESAGSPLRKALVDSGLGEDLSPVSGLETDLKQMIFAVGPARHGAGPRDAHRGPRPRHARRPVPRTGWIPASCSP